MSEIWGELRRAAGATERLVELLNAHPDVDVPAQPVPGKGRIVFENLTFNYPSRPERPALQGFSLQVQPGETVALGGPSGAGKTTVFQSLLRYFTNLVIAHRLATVLNADRIIVMEEGRIVASGSHAELVAQEGLYSRLATMQLRHEQA